MRRILLPAVTSLCLPFAAIYAGSFALSEQSVSGLGVAFAGGAASAEDASTIFFNPAGIALLDQGEIQLGAHFIAPSAEFHDQGSRYNLPGTPFNGLPVTGNNGGDGGVSKVLPNIYVSQPILRGPSTGDLSIGLGVTVPFGLETDYDPGWVGRYAALRTKLTTFDLQPTISYRLWDRLSLGASVDVQYASARLTQAIDFGLAAQQPLAQFFTALPAVLAGRGVPAAAIPGIIAATRAAYANAGFVPGGQDGVTEVEGDDWSVGFTLGAIFEYRKANQGQDSFFQEGRVGFSYRSAIDHTLDGTADFRRVPVITAPGAPVQFPQPNALRGIFFKQNATAQLDLPDIFHLSAYQRFAQKFAAMGDVTWTRWSRLQNVPIVFSNAATPESILNINYDDARRYAVGLEYYACPSLTFRTGFAYDETPIRGPEFRTPRVPDNNRYFLSAGVRWSPARNLDFDLGYAHLFVEDPKVDFTDSQGHELIGRYDAAVDIVSASVTLKWGGPREMAKETSSAKEAPGYRK